jgi:hypothetical protein
MIAPRRINVSIDRLVIDGPVDERALRAAIAAELGGTLAADHGGARARAGSAEVRAAQAVASRVRGSLPSEPRGGPRR